MIQRPKLLLIAGYFPPVRISSGSIRPWNLARCLIDLGWEVTVVTPKISIWDEKNLDNVDIVKRDIERIGLKMIYTNHLLKCLAPWRYNLPKSKFFWFFGGFLRKVTRLLGIQNWVGWVPSALHACSHLQPGDVDVILATGAPFWGFEIAYRLSKRLKKPYVMDYRDLWTNDPFSPVQHKWVEKLERELLINSSAVTVVSPISARILSEKYQMNRKIYSITNGYNNLEVSNIIPKKLDPYSIIFAGSVIPPRRSLEPLFRALKIVKESGKTQWKFHYFGPNNKAVAQEINKWELSDNSIINGNILRKDVLAYQKCAFLNVVLTSSGESITFADKGVIPGKIFELIGMKAQILPIVLKDSSIEEILLHVGISCFRPSETNKIADFIIQCMNGQSINIRNAENYSWDELSKKFNQLLRGLVSR